MSIFECFFKHSYKVTRIGRYLDTSYEVTCGKIPSTMVFRRCTKCGKINRELAWSWLYKEDFRPEDLTETFRDSTREKYI